jgi:hypothetical protein
MHYSTHQEQISRMLTGYWITQALYVAAKLGLADLIKDGPRSSDDLAVATQTHPRSLYRLLRALASVDVFAEQDGHRFALTPLGECLLSVPGSQKALAIMVGEEHYHAFAELLYSVKTGKTAFDKVYGKPVFDFLTEHPEKAQVFDEAMVGVHGRETASMLESYDFSGIGVLADIGGGNGSVLTAVLMKYPLMKGILFDLHGVAERAKDKVKAAALTDRCQVVGGSFFESVPTGADAYMMRHIIHDWDDEKSTKILKNVHKAMGKDGRLLLVESVIRNDSPFGKLLDVAMLVIPGGAERTEEEYKRLYEYAGFRLTKIVPTKTGVCVIEGNRP